MAGERDVDPGAAYRPSGILVAADRLAQLAALADRHRVERVMGDEDSRLALRHSGEAPLDQRHLIAVDAAALEGQRARRVDAEHGDMIALEPGAEVARDVALVAPERCAEATRQIVEGNVVVAGHGEDAMPGGAQPFE